MVVGCPKCKAKLKIPDEKIKPEGTKFKCPKCQAMLLVKRPAKKAAPPPSAPEPQAPPKKPAPEMEPWPEMPQAPGATPPPPFEEEPAPEPPPFPFEEEPAPEPPPFPFEEEPAPEPPPPSFEEEPAPEPPPPSFEEEPAPEPPPPFEGEPAPGAPPPFEGEPAPGAQPTMEPVMEAPAPPAAPPEEKVEKEVPSAEAPTVEAPPEARSVLLAFPDPQMVNMLKFVLSSTNFAVSSATDGVTAMVKALRELPAVLVADVRLPKMHGIELMKRLKARVETKDVKVILTGSKPENQVPTIEGVSGYIQQDRMQQGLVDLIKKVLAEPAAPAPAAEPAAPTPEAAAPKPAAPPADAGVQRAQRFSRTVLADIELYNKEKVDQSVRQGNFESVFAKELQEGRKLYEMRISADARDKGNFYEDAVKAFLDKKKQQLGI